MTDLTDDPSDLGLSGTPSLLTQKSEAKWKPWLGPVTMLATALPPKASAEDKAETVKVYAKLLAFKFDGQPKALEIFKSAVLNGATTWWDEFPSPKALCEVVSRGLELKSEQRRGSWIWKGGERVPI